MSKTFVDRPHADRMAAINALDAIGPCTFSYTGAGITVTVPRGGYLAIKDWAIAHNLDARDWFLFPLGSDRVPEIMRHDGSYPGSRGFHLYAHFIPAE